MRFKLKLKWLILMMIVITLTVGFISAGKSYDENTKTMKLKTFFGNEIADVKLETPLINYVPAGKNVLVAQMEFDAKKVDKFFDKMDFYDLNDGNNKINRGFTFKYIKSISYRTLQDKAKVNSKCDETIGTCEYYVFRTRTIEEPVWEIINKNTELPVGKITIGIFTDVKKGDYVEWIPTFYGHEIEEWASWVEGLNTGLTDYFKFDEAGGAVAKNEIRNNNASTAGVNRWVTGIVNNSYNITGGGYANISNEQDYDDLFNGSSNFSISVWIYPRVALSTGDAVISKGINTKEMLIGIRNYARPSLSFFNIEPGVHSVMKSDDNISINQWQHIVFVYGGGNNITNVTFYLNGTERSYDVEFGNAINNVTNDYEIEIGNGYDNTGDYYFNGYIDELGIWNRR